MTGPRIAITGAGIAGLTAAGYLRRNGLDCWVFEQSPRLPAQGAGVQISPNAGRLLHDLGLEARLRECAVVPESVDILRWNDNALVTRVDLGDRCEAAYGAPYYTIHRTDLHLALSERLPKGCIQLGAACTGSVERDDGLREPDHAPKRYEDIRKARVQQIHELSRANAVTFHVDDGPDRHRRDAALRNFWSLDGLAWLYGYDAKELR